MSFEYIANDSSFNIFIQLLLAIIMSSVIGFERQLNNKSAGLRTEILVCLGATVVTIIAKHGFSGFFIDGHFIDDSPSRIVSQILTGIGFIAGGVILKTKGNVTGLTTAASLWVVAIIGMAIGSGQYFAAILLTIMSLAVLVFIGFMENKYLTYITRKTELIRLDIKTSSEKVFDISKFVKSKFEKVRELGLSVPEESQKERLLSFEIIITSEDPIKDCYERIKDIRDTLSIKLYVASVLDDL